MVKLFKAVSVGVAVFAASIMLVVACGGGGGGGLSGTSWQEDSSPFVLSFEDGGTYSMKGGGMTISGTYEVKGGKLAMTINGLGDAGNSEVSFSVKGDKLSITAPDGSVQTYTKK